MGSREQINPSSLAAKKQALRRQALAARRAQSNPHQLSRRAVGRLLSLPEYRAAQTVMWYVDCRSELRTREGLLDTIASSKRTVVPYCTVDSEDTNTLGLWRITDIEELVRGQWNILEPPRSRWHEPERQVDVRELDFVIVPGVAFSASGGRLGSGHGYYDRLLAKVNASCVLAGLCYECQRHDALVLESQDIRMDVVITESNCWRVG